MNTGKVDN